MIYVYTAITGGKDKLKEIQNTDGAKFVAFLEEPVESKTWEVRPIKRDSGDPVRVAKKYKILPHIYFPDAEYSLWIDGTIALNVPVQTLIDKYLKDTDIAMFKHPFRDCLYDEAGVCKMWHLDDQVTIEEQVVRYANEGYPQHNGLYEATVILRRHTKDIKVLNEVWWDEIVWGSKRDQISLPYVLNKTATDITPIDGYVHDLTGNPYFSYERHLK